MTSVNPDSPLGYKSYGEGGDGSIGEGFKVLRSLFNKAVGENIGKTFCGQLITESEVDSIVLNGVGDNVVFVIALKNEYDFEPGVEGRKNLKMVEKIGLRAFSMHMGKMISGTIEQKHVELVPGGITVKVLGMKRTLLEVREVAQKNEVIFSYAAIEETKDKQIKAIPNTHAEKSVSEDLLTRVFQDTVHKPTST